MQNAAVDCSDRLSNMMERMVDNVAAMPAAIPNENYGSSKDIHVTELVRK